MSTRIKSKLNTVNPRYAPYHWDKMRILAICDDCNKDYKELFSECCESCNTHKRVNLTKEIYTTGLGHDVTRKILQTYTLLVAEPNVDVELDDILDDMLK